MNILQFPPKPCLNKKQAQFPIPVLVCININKFNEMRLSDRLQMHQTRYSQSFSEFANRTKILNSTSGSNTLRLPQLSRSFSSSSKNNMVKVSTLEDTAKNMTNQIRDLRLDTRESKRFCNFLRQDLIDRRLGGTRSDMLQQINALDKLLKMTIKSDGETTHSLNSDCKKLADSTHALKNNLQNLSQRTNALENMMGIYSGKDRHKF